MALFFDWRIARQQGQLDKLVKERDQKIAQLKKATKYDTTQDLLNKYGGSTVRTPTSEKQGTKRKVTTSKPVGQQHFQDQRTGIIPPPTANIPGRGPVAQQEGSRPSTPVRSGGGASTSPPASRNARSPLSSSVLYDTPCSDISPDEPGFAPNAFSVPPKSSTYAPDQQHRWYDRILDIMLGEDETLAKNRLALICTNCRLVNGQAPPGVRTLEGIGRWRCGSCGAWNGLEKVEHEVGKMVQEMKMKEVKEGGDGGWTEVSHGDEDVLDLHELTHQNRHEDDGKEVRDTKQSRVAVRKKSDPMSSSDSDSRSGESEEEEKKSDETVAERVAKSKRAIRRAQK